MRIALILGLALATTAAAQDADTSKLEQELRAQREQLDSLERQMQELRADQAASSASSKRESEQQKTLLTLEYSRGFKMHYRDQQSGNKRFALQFKGRIQIDGQVRLDGSDRKHGASTLNTFKERRSWFAIKGTLYTYWHFVMTVELESGTARSITQTFIANTYFDKARFKLGNIVVPYSLEGNISDKNVRLIERSMAVDFIYPYYELGLMVHGRLAERRLNYWLMVSNGNESARSDNDDYKSVWGRVVALPFGNSTNRYLSRIHIGASGGLGKHNDLAPSASGRGSINTATFTPLVTYRPGIVIDGEVVRAAAEAAWHVGSFGIWGEYLYMRQELADRFSIGQLENVNRKRVSFHGGHVTAAYFLTGETMTFGRPKVLRPLEPGQPDNGNGAWELVGRYDWIQHDGAEGDLEGFFLTAHQPDHVQQIMAGVNWYPNSMVKVSLQWQHAWWNRAIKDDDAILGGLSRPKHQDTLMLRVQLEF